MAVMAPWQLVFLGSVSALLALIYFIWFMGVMIKRRK
jgi:hypothetical protein